MTKVQRNLARPVGAGAGAIVIFVSALAIPLASADSLGLTAGERVGWVMALYAIPGALTLLLVVRHRQPLLLTGNIFLLLFVASLGADIPWAELVGAAMVAGGIVLVMGPLGVTDWLARWIPAPIVHGLLAGAVLHFFVDLFSAVGEEPALVGTTLLAFLAGKRFLEPAVPALLPALLVGMALAAILGDLGPVPDDVTWTPAFTSPELSVRGVLTVSPVMVVLIAAQANVPSMVLLRDHGYEPPERVVGALSGVGTAVGSTLGPVGLSLSLPLTALCAGADAGEHRSRHVAAYVAGTGLLVIGVLAGAAAAVAEVIPSQLLAAFVGMAVLGVLATAVQRLAAGPLVLGPLFAFGIAQSSLELLELGPFFWALAVGVAVSHILEAEQLGELDEH